MNLKESFERRASAKHTYLSTGDRRLDVHMGGVTHNAMHVIAGAQKSGKSKFTDEHFVISPYLDNIARGEPFDFRCAYYSFELDKETVQFNFAAYFFGYDYKIKEFIYKLSTGESVKVNISGRYLQSNLTVLNRKGEVERVIVSQEHKQILYEIIDNRITPMFSKFIWFQEKRTNPTGIQKDIWNHMQTLGEIKYTYYVNSSGEKKKKPVSFTPHNKNLLQLVVIDHVRKLNPEGDSRLMKATIDKMSDYCVELRNFFNISFAVIVHTGRQMASIERQKYQGDELFPSSSDIMDSSNLAQDANFVWTIFNPTDEQYGLKTHFGSDVTSAKFENLRTVHLVEARTAQCPAHFGYDFNGGQGHFKPIPPEPKKTKTV